MDPIALIPLVPLAGAAVNGLFGVGRFSRPVAAGVACVSMLAAFLLSVFAEIYVTTSGGPGLASTNLAFLIYLRALREYDVGGASAAGVIAVILANIVAIFLVRSIAKNIAD